METWSMRAGSTSSDKMSGIPDTEWGSFRGRAWKQAAYHQAACLVGLTWEFWRCRSGWGKLKLDDWLCLSISVYYLFQDERFRAPLITQDTAFSACFINFTYTQMSTFRNLKIPIGSEMLAHFHSDENHTSMQILSLKGKWICTNKQQVKRRWFNKMNILYAVWPEAVTGACLLESGELSTASHCIRYQFINKRQHSLCPYISKQAAALLGYRDILLTKS